jgi:hypothetical protein
MCEECRRRNMTKMGCLFVGVFNQMCPACGKPLGEDFWMTRYCQHCGTRLRED